MLSSNQIELVYGLVCQYDYYVVYYSYDYTEYTVGDTRNYLIEVYVSDGLPELQDGSFSFTDCKYFRITENKYISVTPLETVSFSPLSGSDIVYSNVDPDYPQICYEISQFRNFDFSALYVILGIVLCVSLCFKILFGK